MIKGRIDILLIDMIKKISLIFSYMYASDDLKHVGNMPPLNMPTNSMFLFLMKKAHMGGIGGRRLT